MIVLDGSMRYQVNETIHDMKKGEGLFINSNCLHMGTAVSGQASTMPRH
nr:AraC family ligand binding domain-containing protein [uncultured Blautia sp.]